MMFDAKITQNGREQMVVHITNVMDDSVIGTLELTRDSGSPVLSLKPRWRWKFTGPDSSGGGPLCLEDA